MVDARDDIPRPAPSLLGSALLAPGSALLGSAPSLRPPPSRPQHTCPQHLVLTGVSSSGAGDNGLQSSLERGRRRRPGACPDASGSLALGFVSRIGLGLCVPFSFIHYLSRISFFLSYVCSCRILLRVPCCPWCVLLSLSRWRLLSGPARCQTPRCFRPLL